jgi:O-antigen/teichoic acid export membrane protein
MIATLSTRGDVQRRLVRGFGATALGPVVTAVIQLGSVPLLLYAWGAPKYGDWLLLSAVPSYLALSDLGFGDASGSDMTVRVAAGDRQGALQTFQSLWVLLTSVSLFVLIVASLSFWYIPWQHWLNLCSLTNREAAGVMIALAAYVIVGQQNGILESGFRCDNNFSLGTFWATLLRLVEASLATAVAIVGGSLLSVALTYLATRSIGTLGYGLLLRLKSPWLRLGIEHAKLETVKCMAAPALGFVALPAGNALSLQGYTVLIGAVLGPVAVVAFSTIRTLTRITFQLLSIIARTIWPELSSAFGAGNIPLARTLHRRACQAALVLSVSCGSLLWIMGPFLYRKWLHNSASFDTVCFDVLLLVVAANSFWYTSSVVPMSTNEHHRIALAYLAGTAVSLLMASILVRPLGITGAALALLVIDGWMFWIVLRTALRQVQDTPRDFFMAIATFSMPWRQIKREVFP